MAPGAIYTPDERSEGYRLKKRSMKDSQSTSNFKY
jgi:hypothetical protein